jgi:hypothetical protein
MRKLLAKWVPKCLNAVQKHDQVFASVFILGLFPRVPVGFFNNLIIRDETWNRLYRYDPETNEQSKE